MSWQAYIKTLLDSAGCIKKGAIIGTDGSVWAKSDGTTGDKFEVLTKQCKLSIILSFHLFLSDLGFCWRM